MVRRIGLHPKNSGSTPLCAAILMYYKIVKVTHLVGTEAFRFQGKWWYLNVLLRDRAIQLSNKFGPLPDPSITKINSETLVGVLIDYDGSIVKANFF